MNELSEYIVLPETQSSNSMNILLVESEDSESEKSYSQWGRDSTKILIDAFKIFREKVGSYEVKNLKKMWEMISAYISENYGLKFSPSNCENRWRVLDRNYKKYIENSNKTGRGRKYFEFADEMNEVFQKKTNIHPKILISSNQVIKQITDKKQTSTATENVKEIILDQERVTDKENDEKSKPKSESQKVSRRSNKYRKDVLSDIRADRKKYQEDKLKLEKYRVDKLIEIEEEKLETRKKRNELLKERNNLLQKYLHDGRDISLL